MRFCGFYPSDVSKNEIKGNYIENLQELRKEAGGTLWSLRLYLTGKSQEYLY